MVRVLSSRDERVILRRDSPHGLFPAPWTGAIPPAPLCMDVTFSPGGVGARIVPCRAGASRKSNASQGGLLAGNYWDVLRGRGSPVFPHHIVHTRGPAHRCPRTIPNQRFASAPDLPHIRQAGPTAWGDFSAHVSRRLPGGRYLPRAPAKCRGSPRCECIHTFLRDLLSITPSRSARDAADATDRRGAGIMRARYVLDPQWSEHEDGDR
jgi:hypothetical protein